MDTLMDFNEYAAYYARHGFGTFYELSDEAKLEVMRVYLSRDHIIQNDVVNEVIIETHLKKKLFDAFVMNDSHAKELLMNYLSSFNDSQCLWNLQVYEKAVSNAFDEKLSWYMGNQENNDE